MVGKRRLITRCSFEKPRSIHPGVFFQASGAGAKCQTLEINSLVMTTLDGENNTAEKVREGKRVIDVARWK